MNYTLFNIERLAEISTIALHIYFLYRTLQTKVDTKIQIFASLIFVFVRITFFILRTDHRPFFAVITGIMYASFVFTGNFKTYLVWTIILVVLDGIVDALIIDIYLLFPSTSIEQVVMPGFIRLMIIIIAKIVLFLLYHFITQKIDKNSTIQWHEGIALLIITIGCWVLLEIIFMYGDTIRNEKLLPLLTSGSIVLLLIMANVIALYNRIIKNGKELAHSKLQLHTAELTQDHIYQINEVYEKLSVVRHDLHNHFAAISGYLHEKEYDSLEKYIENLMTIDFSISKYVKHPVLNALISSKVTIAKINNIDFTSEIQLPKNLPITDVDLCILISNILDNAFEANDMVTNFRFIYLHTCVFQSYWVVACRNATCEQNQYKASGFLKSKKKTKVFMV